MRYTSLSIGNNSSNASAAARGTHMKWKPQDIMAELVRRKITQTEIALGLGKSPSAVHRVINGILVSDAIRQEIARRLGVTAVELWPDYYLAPRQRPGRRRKAG